MNGDKLLEVLVKKVEDETGLPWLEGYTSHGSFRPDGSPEGEFRTQQEGEFLLVTVVINLEGSTTDQTTDRLSGDPYWAIVRYDWIGIAETAPSTVSNPEQLDDWSLLKTNYVCENNDAGYWGSHNGSWPTGLDTDGTVTLMDAKGRYQDEPPHSAATERIVKLEVPP